MTSPHGSTSTVPARSAILCTLAAVAALSAACAPTLQTRPPPGPEEIARLEASLAARPEELATLVEVGSAYRAVGRYDEAWPLLERALAISPSHPEATFQLALTYEDLGEFADARHLYDRYLEIGRSPSLRTAVQRRMALLDRKVLRAAIQTAIANETTLGGAGAGASYVAVFPFVYGGSDPEMAPLSRALAELLSTDLGQTDRITILERAQIQILLDELDLAGSGVVDPLTAARGGHLLGAGRIIQGQLTGTDEIVSLQAAVVDVADARVSDPIVEQDALQQLFDLEKRLALSLYTSLGVELTAAERERINRRPTENLQALLQYGMGLLAEDQGDYATAAQHYEGAARLDPAFETARERASETGALAAGAAVTPTNLAALANAEIGPLAGLEEIQRLVPTSISARDASAEVLGNEGLGRESVLEIILRLPEFE